MINDFNFDDNDFLDKRIKVLSVFLFVFILLFLKNLYVLISIVLLLLTILIYVSKGKKIFFSCISSILVSLFVFATLIFTYGQTETATFILPIYKEGINLGIIILLRIFASVTALTLLIRTTSVYSIISTLQWIKLPATFVNLTALILQYIIILGNKAEQIKMALIARCGMSDKLSWWKKIRNIAYGAGSLLIQSFDISIIIHKAMLARGYNPYKNMYSHPQIKTRNIFAGLIILIIFASILLIDYRLGGFI